MYLHVFSIQIILCLCRPEYNGGACLERCVMEVGCGVGLVSLVLQRFAGASCVFATDYSVAVLGKWLSLF
jgi:methylase of polypeptide subunit release factors